ncbi:MAG: ATP-binding protein, partial [Candidatus Latescibacterota bacterium]|nr:ATP-binding protein [Candidatus Latescibacterota bacterium]
MADVDNNVDLSIPMQPDMEVIATSVAESMGVFMGLEEDKVDEVKIAIVEACINAFEHSKSEERRIDVSFSIDDSGLTININDGGSGFDMDEAMAKIAEKRSEGIGDRGWGLTLIYELMDEVSIASTPKGTLV